MNEQPTALIVPIPAVNAAIVALANCIPTGTTVQQMNNIINALRQSPPYVEPEADSIKMPAPKPGE